MNNDQLVGLVGETDAYAVDTPLPDSIRSGEAALVEIEQRIERFASADEPVPLSAYEMPSRYVRTRRGAWVAAAAAGVIVLVVGGGMWLVRSQPGGDAAQAPGSPTEQRSPLFQAADGGEGGPVERPVVDGSGSAATRSTPLPDFVGAVAGDDGAGPLPLGAVNELPGEDYLDFLFEECDWPGVEGCFRDAHFKSTGGSSEGSGTGQAGRPFHVRHGFINNGDEPLGDGFDVVVYMTPMDNGPSEGGGVPGSATVRYTSDYVLQGISDQCGPTYKSQTEPATCEWFVHDFPDGLSAGRYAMWAVWEAPCRAWVDLGFTDTCDDPNQVISLFSSGVDSPIG